MQKTTTYKIIEAIFEITARTMFEKQGRDYLNKYNRDKTYEINPADNTITILSKNNRPLYVITIKKA
jgi:hypothetical protein